MTPLTTPLPEGPRATRAVRLGRRSSFLLAFTSLLGLAAFAWPLLIHTTSGPNNAHGTDAPWIFLTVMPLLLAIVMAELADGELDAKAVALLGILAAAIAALRVPVPGADGFEPMWFLLVLSARVFGRGFGFVLGALGFFASALITGGVGPWLPFQMFAAGWVGFFAGCLPPMRGLAERLMLAGYAAAAALAYGLLINFWFWPFVSGHSSGPWAFEPGAGIVTNLHRFVLFDLVTSFAWDLARAATSVVLILVLGKPVLAALRRATRRAVFEPVVVFESGRPGPASSDSTG